MAARKRKEPSPAILEASRDLRVAIRQLNQHERYLTLLKHAQSLRLNKSAANTLADVIASGESELQSLSAYAKGPVPRRRRPKKPSDSTTRCTVYIDECGSSSLKSKDAFGAFVIAAIIIPDEDYQKLDRLWKKWKADNLGSATRMIHEPDIRRGQGPFSFSRNTQKRTAVINSLNEFIAKLDFSAIACVVNRNEYVKKIGHNAMDSSLPEHPYLMTLDFLLERVVLVLQNQFNNAQARIVAEARGPLEDAILQYEYVRLQIEGTSYISPAWFRQQLHTAIDFRTKKENSTGLQLADLLARPCGEKVLDPSSTPDRWHEFQGKLCRGQETAHSILGLKIVPWDDCYEDLCKS